MRGNKTIKTVACIVSAAFFLSIPTSIAHAESNSAEQGVAGIAAILENATADELSNAYKASIEILSKSDSPYANLGVSIADNYVNIRKDPSTDSEVVGKLYRGCAANILETLEGDWVKIKSGDVEGYIASTFLAIGDEAETMVDKYATKYATVNTQTLRVREKQSTDSKILTLIPKDETYVVVKEYGDWVEILLGNDDETGGEFTGFVNKEFVNITVEFKYAISIEEENRIKQEQAEAEKAEAERKRKLAEEEAVRAEEARKAAEAAQSDNSDNSDNSNNNDNNDGNSQDNSQPTADTSSLSELRNEIITYALKFVGNPYVWGGESLTRGADCSGFVQAIYADFGYSIPRVSRDQAASAGKKVSESDLRPGDLIFYTNSSGRVNHVAMYIGNGMIVHAANSRQGIITSQYKYRDIYCVRRIVY
ncbi:MAG TPA: NlpC/P60 family protein [Mobilitalea sp.]|nr:NlpC/P60 family protein [Mobilitalea sp.]